MTSINGKSNFTKLVYLVIIFAGIGAGFYLVTFQKSLWISLSIFLAILAIVFINYFSKQNGIFKTNVKVLDILLFLILFSGPPKLRSRDPLDSFRGEYDLSVIVNIAVWLFAGIWILAHILPMFLKKPVFKNLHSLHALAFFFTFSLALSTLVSPVPLMTGFRAFQVLCMILFGYLYLEKYGIKITVNSLLFSYIVIGLAIAVSAIFNPQLVFVGTRMRGDLIANAGAVGSIGLILLLSDPWFKAKKTMILLIVLFLTILALSRTRAAYASFIAFLLLNLLRAPRIFGLKMLRTILLLSIPLLILYSDQTFNWLVRDIESISTLSDRTRIWQTLFIETMEDSPLLGLGFYAERMITLTVNPGIGSAHGTLAMVFSGAGLFGLISFALLWLSMVYNALHLWLLHPKDPMAFLAFSLLVAISSIGFVSEEMIIAGATGFSFYILLSLSSAIRQNKSFVKNY